MYETWEKDIQVEEFLTEDAEVVIAAYGVSARVAKSRSEERRVGKECRL